MDHEAPRWSGETKRPADATRGMVLAIDIADHELTWEAEHDGEVHPVIERLMEEGVRFFVLKGDRLGWSEPDAEGLRLNDAGIAALVDAGVMGVRRPRGGAEEIVGVVTSAEEAVTLRTLAVRPH